MDDRFHRAARDGYLDLLREATKRDCNCPDEDGMTPTLLAAQCGNLEALRMIIGRGGNPDKCDYLGRTALHHSARNGHYNCVSFLVSWGCNLWAKDNDYISALEMASVYEKVDIMKYLDSVQGIQASKNKKTVEKLKEKAIMDAEKSIKRYEKLQEEAQRKAEKEGKKLAKVREMIENRDAETMAKPTFKDKLKTLAFRNKSRQKMYSEYTGNPTISGRGVARKVQRKAESLDQFKVGEVDELGKRTVRSMSGLMSGTEVMYVPNKFSTKSGIGDECNQNFGQGFINGDSGVNSYDCDSDDIQSGSIFNRPGVGKLAFLPRKSAVETLRSYNHQEEDETPVDMLSNNNHYHNRENSVADSIGTANTLVQRMKDLPWNEEEVENLDDDEELSDYSPLELFLATCGLSNYLAIFTKEKIDLEALTLLKDEDLRQLGIEMGPRKKLSEAVQHRKDIIQYPGKITDSYL